ncbi:MAG: hypothetical protein OEO83_13965 [Alphaproteobacteria bacterium]|nr:hypothetical protein [Alphaproteobacteria bacterium]
MYKPSRAAAEAHFTTKQKQIKQIQKEKDKAREERMNRMARLKAQRLSQEGAGEDTAEPEATNSPVSDPRQV